MKRSAPLVRRTPLARGTTPLARARTPRKSSTSRSTIPKAARMAAYDRAGGVCDSCGRALARDGFDAHHRLRRAHGRDDSLAVLVALHRACHRWVHDNVADARARGLLIRSTDDPATSPVRRGNGRWYLPGTTWTPVPDPTEE